MFKFDFNYNAHMFICQEQISFIIKYFFNTYSNNTKLTLVCYSY